MTADGSGWVYVWDAENNLKSASKNNQILEFKYDYLSRRIEKTVKNSGIVYKQERYIYDGYRQVEKVDSFNNNMLQKFMWKNDSLMSVIDVPNSIVYFCLQDANKNITEIIDINGTFVAHYEYNPFGGITMATGAYASSNPFRFSNEYADDETGLIYYNYRYYSANFGRWLSRDLIDDPGLIISINKKFVLSPYSFVNNSAPNNVDLLGLSDCGAICRAAASAALNCTAQTMAAAITCAKALKDPSLSFACSIATDGAYTACQTAYQLQRECILCLTDPPYIPPFPDIPLNCKEGDKTYQWWVDGPCKKQNGCNGAWIVYSWYTCEKKAEGNNSWVQTRTQRVCQ